MYCFGGCISSPYGGTQSVKLTKVLTKGTLMGQSRSRIEGPGCDLEGHILKGKASVEVVNL